MGEQFLGEKSWAHYVRLKVFGVNIRKIPCDYIYQPSFIEFDFRCEKLYKRLENPTARPPINSGR